MKTKSRVVTSFLVSAAPYLALFAAGTVLARPLHLPLPGPAVGLLVALVALRIGVMRESSRGAPGEGTGAGERRPSRAALHAAHV